MPAAPEPSTELVSSFLPTPKRITTYILAVILKETQSTSNHTPSKKVIHFINKHINTIIIHILSY